ncbi:MAG: hypothetical protein O9325_10435 [Roseomonas sp.]|nr:hypothetical protein [Roseomonas sp.]
MRWAALLLLLGGCAAGDLDRMKDLDARGDWAALAAMHLPECDGPRDALCAEAHFLRARGCARLASGHLSESDRRRALDCAVEGGRAALAASAATAPDKRRAWREAYAAALFARRQALPGRQACADNAALWAEADRLRAEAPAAPRSRFLAASARLSAARLCDAPACPTLAEAAPLLRDPPAEAAAQWRALSAAIETTARSLSC